MSISNYTELKAAVVEWVNHPQAAGKEADFVALAEAEISADLKVKPMNLEQSVAVSAGARSVALPANLIDPISFKVVGARDPDVVIKSSEQLERMEAGLEPYSPSRVYGAIVGRTLKVFPALSAGTVSIYGKCSIPSLSDAEPTNWLLTAFPTVYLFAAIREAGYFLHDERMIVGAEARYQQAIAKVSAQYVYRGQMAAPTVRGAR